MPHLKINKQEFDSLLGKEIEEEKLEEEASFLGVHWNHIEGDKWDVEVYPDRPDLLSVEGLARAYRGFFGLEKGREIYHVNEGDTTLEIEESVEEVRPYIGAAVIRDLDLSERIINGLVQLQEKLHESMGRRRDKLAIGLHDMESIESPFTYRAVEPEKVSFQPLEYGEELNLGEILEEHEKGQEYAWILEEEDRYPVIVDFDGQVLSFPPVINNQLTEVTASTDKIFVDVTGKDRQTVMKALNIIVTALAERGGHIESVEVEGEEMPDLSPEEFELDPGYLEDVSGLELRKSEIIGKLKEMRMGAKSGRKIKVDVPSYRTDIMHQYDLIEDVAIAYGYENIEPELPEVDQVAQEQPGQNLSRKVRETLQGTGALETHTYLLSNREKLFHKMEVEDEQVAEMSNPLTEDYTTVRNWLLPSLMSVLERNRHRSYPQKFFEVAEVSELDETDTGASNRKKIAYVHAGNSVDYTQVRQVLQVLERDLGIDLEVREGGKNCFKPDRKGEIFLEDEKIGDIGEMKEEVVENWGLDCPAAGLEIDFDSLRK